MDHVLKESDHYEENLIRYQSKLDAYGELKDLEEREVAAITQELNEMLEEKDENKSKLDENFNSMQSRMRQIGIGLIMTKTGKQIPDKVKIKFLFPSSILFKCYVSAGREVPEAAKVENS